MLSLGGERLTPLSDHATAHIMFFAHLLILDYLVHCQNLNSSSVYQPGPVNKILSKSVHNCLKNVVHKQTDRQTNATKM